MERRPIMLGKELAVFHEQKAVGDTAVFFQYLNKGIDIGRG
jgi:hypothetical protein